MTGVGAITAAQREQALIEQHGSERYRQLVELERARLSRARLDLRFYLGASMALAGAALLYFKPDVGAAAERAERRLGAAFRRSRARTRGR